ncbi:MAG: hypothetical protein CVU84_06765 [Firmicutes bacterium HGW-Firmicutes-1]|jgi:methyltransferase (TIGR00027 family)|nr:MAG: hypothetical protein CVU84_06765 [Firmicutes bacterium HGW-Firmicutes-1]
MKNERVASQTAMLIASLRALACYEEDAKIRGGDTLAELFLPDDKRKPLQFRDLRNQIKKMIPEGLYEYVIARTKYFDELFQLCLCDGFSQIVLLGAGYDSRAYRFAGLSCGAVIFDTDTVITQQEKCWKLMEGNVTIPENVIFVPIDFNHDDLFEILGKAGYDEALPTLFIWEGVTFYLNPQAVDTMLKTISNHASRGSLLSFDFQHTDREYTLIDTQLKDEQIKFGMDTERCAEYLGGFGFTLREKLDAQSLESRYLITSGGIPFGKINPIMHLVTAEL